MVLQGLLLPALAVLQQRRLLLLLLPPCHHPCPAHRQKQTHGFDSVMSAVEGDAQRVVSSGMQQVTGLLCNLNMTCCCNDTEAQAPPTWSALDERLERVRGGEGGGRPAPLPDGRRPSPAEPPAAAAAAPPAAAAAPPAPASDAAPAAAGAPSSVALAASSSSACATPSLTKKPANTWGSLAMRISAIWMAAACALMSREVSSPATKLLMGRSASTCCSCWGEPTASSLVMVARQRARTQAMTVEE